MADYEKGDRVKIISGPDAGVVGEIFWWGESKFGDGMRAGITAQSGKKYWAGEEDLGKEGDPIVEKEKVAKEEGDDFERGDAVEIIAGDHEGHSGTIVWWGPSKYGEGMRAGVQTASGEKFWVDEAEIKHE